MTFRLIVKGLNSQPLFPSRHITLDEIKRIVNEYQSEDSASILRAIKPYTEKVRSQTFTFSYEEVVRKNWLSTLFREKSTRVISLNPLNLERSFSFKGRNVITGFDCIMNEYSLQKIIVYSPSDEWDID